MTMQLHINLKRIQVLQVVTNTKLVLIMVYCTLLNSLKIIGTAVITVTVTCIWYDNACTDYGSCRVETCMHILNKGQWQNADEKIIGE